MACAAHQLHILRALGARLVGDAAFLQCDDLIGRASASGNRFQQSSGTSVFDANALAAGFMVANAQLTNRNDNNNELLAAENMMMVKEHIIDTYGEIRVRWPALARANA
jgi:hypothetical protein